jgi:hypothetical protein
LIGTTSSQIFSAAKARDGGGAEALLLRQGDLVKFQPVDDLPV